MSPIPRQRTPRRSPTPDGTPSLCRDGCGRRIMWFTSNYGSRVQLDVEPVSDDDEHARYWIDWDGPNPVAMSWRKQSFRPDGAGQPKYSTHFDTCPITTSAPR